jgi:hypothetical protein
MTEHVASRTLVKSPPELWAECSEATSLARHLDQFGEIRITRLEPETAVAWEGESARGTVRIEPSGWGTKVILTAVAAEEELVSAAPEPRREPEPPDPVPPVAAEVAGEPDPDSVTIAEPVEAVEPTMDVPARRGRFSRLFGFFKAPPREAVLLVEPVTVQEPRRKTEPAAEAQLQPEPERAPEAELQPEPIPELGLEAQLAPEPIPDPAPEPQSIAPDAPAATEMPATEAALTAALDSLGQAHHRPYSRA